MTQLPTSMNVVTSPIERQHDLVRRPTANKPPRTVDGEESDDEEEEDDKEEDEEDVPKEDQLDPTKKAFDEILEQIKTKELKLGKKEERHIFFQKYDQYFKNVTAENKNLLHVLAYHEGITNFSLKTFITRLSKRYSKLYSELLVAKDDTGGEYNPLYAAVFRKNAKLVSWMCENKENSPDIKGAIEKALGMECRERNDNCMHLAVRKLPPEVTIDLIKKTTEKTLRAQDSKGFTPLHYAVEYERCTDSQLNIVKALIQHGNSALDRLANKPDCYSVYRYHESTRQNYLIKTQKEQHPHAKRPTKNPRDRNQAMVPRQKSQAVIDEMRPSDSSNVKPRADLPQKKQKEKQKDKSQTMKVEIEPRNDASVKRRESNIKSPIDPKERHLQEQNGHLHEEQEALSPIETRQDAPAESLESGYINASKSPVWKDSVEQKRKRNEEPEVTVESADKIREVLKLHYLRTRSPEVAASCLYGKNPKETQICFDYFGAPPEVDPDKFKASFKNIDFDDVLQYVAFPNVRVRPELPDFIGNSPGVRGKGCCDMMFFFEWLREKNVKRILKVIVNDLDEPAHSDEAIEKALSGFEVEILDWQKVDLCPETMYRSSKKLKEVHLRWSGNNTVLRAWSELDGLRRLGDLTKVYLYVKQVHSTMIPYAPSSGFTDSGPPTQELETSIRTTENIDEFRKRLTSKVSTVDQPRQSSSPGEESQMPPITLEVLRNEKGIWNERHLTTNLTSLPTESKQEPTLQPHKWLDCMDKSADMIQGVWAWAKEQKLQQQDDLQNPVEVALIDDGVDFLHSTLSGKISSGKSFDYKSFDYGDKGENRVRPHWISERGHGTGMASLITRVCPMAQMYVIKLETHSDHRDQKAKIMARSAAKAIDAAVDRNVKIISMSWTIKQPENNSEDKEKFDAAVRRAVNAGILMFCSASDKGSHHDSDYPAASHPSKMFRIGAAKANGNAWDWIGDINNLDFIIPGHEVPERKGDDSLRKLQAQTGSSVATALGAGLAALIISCVQLAAIHTQLSQQESPTVTVSPTAVVAKDLTDVKKHENMKAAFEAIGTSRESQNKFIEVWKVFDKAEKDLKSLEKDKRLGVVADLARKFVRQ